MTTSFKSHRMKTNVKNILQWTSGDLAPFNFMGEGNSAFIKNQCKYTNCFVIDHKTHLSMDPGDFDAIAFNGRDLNNLQIPKVRTIEQKYIFGAMESADNYPICNPIFDGFFNWTWTYRLDSDFRFGYITIYDMNGTVVGPAVNMKWPEVLEPVSDELKDTLSKKKKAGAWFVSNCNSKSKREIFMNFLQNELKQYNLSVDVYGSCGNFNCPRKMYRACAKLVKEDYYFYFSLENSFSEDYVTEKLLTALNNYAIPVVFGAADYTRFLPPGSYLDGKQLGVPELAQKMYEIINNKTLFYDYFRWRNHYVYKETSSKEDICKLCEMLNNEEKVSEVSEWPDFRRWWNGERYRDNCYRVK
ncbi:unnamed protein product [Danaus chrysippus]|uniref:Fucosyltransferase n=1 Tax=Danaus chrysippus TaxID=151541 RepID=A0A8J2QRW9_9NEOP|nr:unnamed protein product [Danaus chrysippus]